jgi:hypothetical protein
MKLREHISHDEDSIRNLTVRVRLIQTETSLARIVMISHTKINLIKNWHSQSQIKNII